MTKRERRHRCEVATRKKLYRTLEMVGELCGVTKHSVQNWIAGVTVPTGPAWKKLQALSDICIEEEPTQAQRVEVAGLVKRICHVRHHTHKTVAQRLGCSVHHVSRIAKGDVVPVEGDLAVLRHMAARVSMEAKRFRWSEHSPQRRFKTSVAVVLREYKQKLRSAPEYKAIDKMRSDICEPGDCPRCRVDCTARENA